MSDLVSRFDCSLCLEKYDVTSRCPKMLPCIHTVCERCLMQLIGAAKSSKFYCPLCRQVIKTPKNGAKGFRTNIYLVPDQDTACKQAKCTFCIETAHTLHLLQCGHGFCQSCVSTIKLACPVCAAKQGPANKPLYPRLPDDEPPQPPYRAPLPLPRKDVAKQLVATAPSMEEIGTEYADGCSITALNSLMKESWYHDNISRQSGDEILKRFGGNGTFLVRASQQGDETHPYTLMVLLHNHTYNLRIRKQPNNGFIIGERSGDDVIFEDVPSLIAYHMENELMVNNKQSNCNYLTMLKHHPPSTNIRI